MDNNNSSMLVGGRRESNPTQQGGGLANYLVAPLQSRDPEDQQQLLKSVKELFESIDKDGDGFVGANELRNYLIGKCFR
jgi:EF hand